MPEDAKFTTLISFLTRSLKKPVQKEQAENVLREIVEDREIEAPRRRFQLWLGALWLLVAVALGCVWQHYRKPYFHVSSIDVGGWFSFPVLRAVPVEGLTQKERWLLGVGDEPELEQKRKLHESEPDKVLYYMQYAFAYEHKHGTLPEGYLATVRRLDPGNAALLHYAAGMFSEQSCERGDSIGEMDVSREKDGIRLPPRLRPHQYKVLDQQVLDQAVSLLEQASALEENRPIANDHVTEVVAIFDRLHERDAILRSLRCMFYAVGAGVSSELSLARVRDALGAAAQQAVKAGDKQQFAKLVELRDAYLKSESNRANAMLIPALVYRVVASSTAVNFLHASQALGIASLEERFQAEVDQFNERNDQLALKQNGIDGRPDPRLSTLLQEMIPAIQGHVVSPPAFAAEDAKPMRIAEHEFASQWAIMGCLILLLILTPLMWFARSRFPKTIRKPAARTVLLLGAKDWLWVFSMGVVLPVLAHEVLIQWTPFGGRNYGIPSLGYAYPILPLVILVIASLTASALLIRWRLGMRLPLRPTVGPPSRVPLVFLALMIIILLVSYPLLASVVDHGSEKALMRLTAILCVIGGLLLAFAGWALKLRFRGKSEDRFRMAATLAALPVCLPFLIVALCALLPLHLAGEKRWVTQDHTFTLDPDARDYGLYEGKIARQFYKEINQIVGID